MIYISPETHEAFGRERKYTTFRISVAIDADGGLTQVQLEKVMRRIYAAAKGRSNRKVSVRC